MGGYCPRCKAFIEVGSGGETAQNMKKFLHKSFALDFLLTMWAEIKPHLPRIIREARLFFATLLVGGVLVFLANSWGFLNKQETYVVTEKRELGGDSRRRSRYSSTETLSTKVETRIITDGKTTELVAILLAPYLLLTGYRISLWTLKEIKSP